MSEPLRCFWAVSPPEPIRASLAPAIDAIAATLDASRLDAIRLDASRIDASRIDTGGARERQVVDAGHPVPAGVGAQAAPLTEAVRYVPAEQLHITLKFIDAIERGALPKLVAGVASRLSRQAPFDVTLAGVGAFPGARDARVLWVGVADGTSQLARAARGIDAASARCGVARERRPFRPHLTIARLRSARAIALQQLPAPESATFRVQEAVLYESRPSSQGATHIPLSRLPFGQAPEDLDTFFADLPALD